jgi:hypothetical protein
VLELLKGKNVVPAGGSTVLLECGLFDEVDGFDPAMVRCEDYDMWVRLAMRSPLACVDRPLVAYRVWAGSMSTDIDAMRAGHESVIEKYRGEVDSAIAREGDLQKEQYLGRFYIRNRDRVGALRHYVRTAVELRTPRQAVHGVLAFLSPGFSGWWRDRHERREVPDHWAAEAEAWLRHVPVAPDVHSITAVPAGPRA